MRWLTITFGIPERGAARRDGGDRCVTIFFERALRYLGARSPGFKKGVYRGGRVNTRRNRYDMKFADGKGAKRLAPQSAKSKNRAQFRVTRTRILDSSN
jgi:hypothetical protein